MEKVLEEKEKEKEAEEPKIKFFKSPIPEPKKHVSRVVDYDHEFNDELLKDIDFMDIPGLNVISNDKNQIDNNFYFLFFSLYYL